MRTRKWPRALSEKKEKERWPKAKKKQRKEKEAEGLRKKMK